MRIIPSILVPTFSEFERQARRLEGIFELAQIDVMDGQFVTSKSFDEIEKINELRLRLNFELHLMVAHPIDELEKWYEVKNIKRVIFHIESQDNPQEIIARIRGKCWDAGIAINPKTPLEKIEPYINLVDMVLFMTVYPGEQGAQFLPEVGEKIKKFINCHPRENGDLPKSVADSRFRGNDKILPLIAVDGGINADNIALVKSWGVEVFGVGSAISKTKDIKKTLEELELQLNTVKLE
ncbi:MAG: ribulose-phosphate 3-epimerase [Candidatus Magasanikbacteria bacterium]